MGSGRVLIVEVIDAHNLQPKDGQGTSSPYVEIGFHGHHQRTHTVHRNLNPVWNETLKFEVKGSQDLIGKVLEVDVYHDRRIGPTRRNNFLGRTRLDSGLFVKKGEEALMYFALEKKSFFSWIQGEIGLKVYYVDEPVSPSPTTPEAEESKKVEPQEKSQSEENPPSKQAQSSPEEVRPTENLQEKQPEPSEHATENGKQAAFIEKQLSEPVAELMSAKVSGPEPANLVRLSSATNLSRRLDSEDVPERISSMNDQPSYGLVEKMYYLFVTVVKARFLPGNCNPFIKIAIPGSNVRSKTAMKTSFFEWDETFAFLQSIPVSSYNLEISVWDSKSIAGNLPVVSDSAFLGGICFDVSDIPMRDPPDSPSAPQWYRLEGGGAQGADIMIATWIGTQADESFSDAWKNDASSHVTSKAKVYLSPKLWYLRVMVIEAHDLLQLENVIESGFTVKLQLGFQILKTRISDIRNGSLSWNEDHIFVTSEPFSNQYLICTLDNHNAKEKVGLGFVRIPLTSIERRVDDRKVASRWFDMDNSGHEEKTSTGRLHLRICLDGGYHVNDEATHAISDYRPSARQLWRPPIGILELGIIGCRNLLPIKTVSGKGVTDSYCVAKYGPKWVRTRTIVNSFDPRWNEQYTWQVYDPSTVLTLGVFDSWGIHNDTSETEHSTRPDFRMGKIRIRLSALEINNPYQKTYPLLVLQSTGVKKMGDIEISVRFSRSCSKLDILQLYMQPMLPTMHYVKPIGVLQRDSLRGAAVRIIADHLSRAEPPLRKEVVTYMLDSESNGFSLRKIRANWFRIVHVVASTITITKWVEDTRQWRNTTATLLAHAVWVMFVWYPGLVLPAFFLYICALSSWNYRYHSVTPGPDASVTTSLADMANEAEREDLDEEFDPIPSRRPEVVVRMRYERLRRLGCRFQEQLSEIADLVEKLQAVVMWRDPRASLIFVGVCLTVSMIMLMIPMKMVFVAAGFYFLRHPMSRDRKPAAALNFFQRLPSLSDHMM